MHLLALRPVRWTPSLMCNRKHADLVIDDFVEHVVWKASDDKAAPSTTKRYSDLRVLRDERSSTLELGDERLAELEAGTRRIEGRRIVIRRARVER